MRPNPLPAVERWKIFDNLRRTLGPPALVLLLVLGWTVLPGPPWLWTAAVLAVVAWPLLLQTASIPFRTMQALGGGKGSPIPSGLGNTAAQVLLSAAFLAEQARLLVDAIGRTLVRLFVTRRNLLEWETAAATEQRLGNGLVPCLRSMWFSPVLAVVLGLVLALVRPDALAAAAPFLAAWLVAPLVAFWVSRPPRVARDAADRRGDAVAAAAGPQDVGLLRDVRRRRGQLAAARQLPGRAARGRSPTARRPPTWGCTSSPAWPPMTSAI